MLDTTSMNFPSWKMSIRSKQSKSTGHWDLKPLYLPIISGKHIWKSLSCFLSDGICAWKNNKEKSWLSFIDLCSGSLVNLNDVDSESIPIVFFVFQMHQQNGSFAQNVVSVLLHDTICWFWRHPRINKWCHYEGQKQQIVRWQSTTHINKCVDLQNGLAVQIAVSGTLSHFL